MPCGDVSSCRDDYIDLLNGTADQLSTFNRVYQYYQYELATTIAKRDNFKQGRIGPRFFDDLETLELNVNQAQQYVGALDILRTTRKFRDI